MGAPKRIITLTKEKLVQMRMIVNSIGQKIGTRSPHRSEAAPAASGNPPKQASTP